MTSQAVSCPEKNSEESESRNLRAPESNARKATTITSFARNRTKKHVFFQWFVCFHAVFRSAASVASCGKTAAQTEDLVHSHVSNNADDGLNGASTAETPGPKEAPLSRPGPHRRVKCLQLRDCEVLPQALPPTPPFGASPQRYLQFRPGDSTRGGLP